MFFEKSMRNPFESDRFYKGGEKIIEQGKAEKEDNEFASIFFEEVKPDEEGNIPGPDEKPAAGAAKPATAPKKAPDAKDTDEAGNVKGPDAGGTAPAPKAAAPGNDMDEAGNIQGPDAGNDPAPQPQAAPAPAPAQAAPAAQNNGTDEAGNVQGPDNGGTNNGDTSGATDEAGNVPGPDEGGNAADNGAGAPQAADAGANGGDGQGAAPEAQPSQNSDGSGNGTEPPADGTEQQKDLGPSKEVVDKNERIRVYRNHRKLYDMNESMLDTITALLPNTVSPEVRTQYFRIQKDLLRTSGQIDYALNIDYKTANLDRIKEIYKILEKKVTFISETMKKLRDKEYEHKFGKKK